MRREKRREEKRREEKRREETRHTSPVTHPASSLDLNVVVPAHVEQVFPNLRVDLDLLPALDKNHLDRVRAEGRRRCEVSSAESEERASGRRGRGSRENRLTKPRQPCVRERRTRPAQHRPGPLLPSLYTCARYGISVGCFVWDRLGPRCCELAGGAAEGWGCRGPRETIFLLWPLARASVTSTPSLANKRRTHN